MIFLNDMFLFLQLAGLVILLGKSLYEVICFKAWWVLWFPAAFTFPLIVQWMYLMIAGPLVIESMDDTMYSTLQESPVLVLTTADTVRLLLVTIGVFHGVTSMRVHFRNSSSSQVWAETGPENGTGATK